VDVIWDSRRVSKPALIHSHRSLGAGYSVTLPAFEGPLELLLHLIEKEELDISEISLLAVTDQYLRTIQALEEIGAGALADFLLVASRLLYIKSSKLIPRREDEDEEEDEESAEALVRHLLEYRQFKRASSELRERDEAGWRVFVRPLPGAEIVQSQRPVDLGDIDLLSMQRALIKVLQRVPVEPSPPKLQPYTVTVADKIETIRDLLLRAMVEGSQSSGRLLFSALLDSEQSRLEVIVTFLAVLELVKQKELHALQSDTFGEIVLIPRKATSGLEKPSRLDPDPEGDFN
jgi:segregation and condensation protein A